MQDELSNLNEHFYKTKTERELAQANFDAYKKQVTSLEQRIYPTEKKEKQSPEYIRIKDQLDKLEQEKKRLLALGLEVGNSSKIENDIRETEAKLIELKKIDSEDKVDYRLIALWKKMREELIEKEINLDLMTNNVDLYKKMIDKYKDEHPELLEQTLELVRLERQKKVYQESYDILVNKLEEERIKLASHSGGIKIIDQAFVPTTPIDKRLKYYYIGAIAAGLALGIAIALGLELTDTTIKTSEDVEKYLNVTVLGTIPHIDFGKGRNAAVRVSRSRSSSQNPKDTIVTEYPQKIVNFFKEDNIVSEAYRSLRTNLLFINPDHTSKTVVICSSAPHEGKSITTANLAIACAVMGNKVLVVDADLRRPVMHHIFDIPRNPGLSDFFFEEKKIDEIIHRTELDNLFAIPSGHSTPNPSELIGSKRMTEILKDLKNKFDFIFFDSPPLIAVTDAVLLSTKTDTVLLVVKSSYTERELAKKAITNLFNVKAKIAGVILNDINLSQRYSSYGYYKYYYHYYKTRESKKLTET